MRTSLLRSLFLIVGLSLACGTAMAAHGKADRLLDDTLYNYSGAIRWSDFDRAYDDYMDPAERAAHPLTDLDRARYKQVEVTQYAVKASVDADTTTDRDVEIHLVNRHTQVERVVKYHEHWRYDAKGKRWWLTTGLPDITEGSDE